MALAQSYNTYSGSKSPQEKIVLMPLGLDRVIRVISLRKDKLYVLSFLAVSSKYTEKTRKISQFFQVVIHFNSSHLQPKIVIRASFCALVG